MASLSADIARATDTWAEEVLLTDLRDGLLRQPRVRTGGSAVRSGVDERTVVNFSSNDYLGMSVHPAVRAAASEAALEYGVGSTGSRHLSGSHAAALELEAELCAFEHSATATLAPTGYAANMAALTAVAGEDAVIYSDALNHASIIDGCRASRARVEVFRHRDLDDLAARLRAAPARPVIVSDTVFSTEATCADVAGLAELARQHDAWLVLDEAHATGVVGPDGRGAAAAAGVETEPMVVRVVTFSQARGASGAAVCAAPNVSQLLLQRGRALIYSTALAHPVVAGVRAALRVLSDDPTHRQRLRDNTALMQLVLDPVASPVRDQTLPIVPVILGDAQRTMAAEHALWEQGWMVHALRPPTVTPGASRLRVMVSAAHTEADVRDAAAAVRAVAV